jgi:hypothetical protein
LDVNTDASSPILGNGGRFAVIFIIAHASSIPHEHEDGGGGSGEPAAVHGKPPLHYTRCQIFVFDHRRVGASEVNVPSLLDERSVAIRPSLSVLLIAAASTMYQASSSMQHRPSHRPAAAPTDRWAASASRRPSQTTEPSVVAGFPRAVL